MKKKISQFRWVHTLAIVAIGGVMLRCWLLLVLNYLAINSRSVTEKLHGSHIAFFFFFGGSYSYWMQLFRLMLV